MTLLRAFRLLILRDLLAQRVRTTTTIAGIALGIGVLLAIQLAAAAAQRGFEHGVENLAGRAALEITQAPMGIDERNLPELAWLQELGQVTPIVEGTAVYTDADGWSQVLTVFGIDILTDAAFRDYAFAAFANGANGADGASKPEAAGGTYDARRVVAARRHRRRRVDRNVRAGAWREGGRHDRAVDSRWPARVPRARTARRRRTGARGGRQSRADGHRRRAGRARTARLHRSAGDSPGRWPRSRRDRGDGDPPARRSRDADSATRERPLPDEGDTRAADGADGRGTCRGRTGPREAR